MVMQCMPHADLVGAISQAEVNGVACKVGQMYGVWYYITHG